VLRYGPYSVIGEAPHIAARDPQRAVELAMPFLPTPLPTSVKPPMSIETSLARTSMPFTAEVTTFQLIVRPKPPSS